MQAVFINCLLFKYLSFLGSSSKSTCDYSGLQMLPYCYYFQLLDELSQVLLQDVVAMETGGLPPSDILSRDKVREKVL